MEVQETRTDRTVNKQMETRTKRDDGVDQAFWSSIAVLFIWRRFIAAITVFVALAAIIISLLLPKWYMASSRLLLPESTGVGGLSSMLGNLPAAATTLLSSRGGNYLRFIAILSSRTTFGAVVDEFNLIDVYDTGGSATPREDAILALSGNVDFVVDQRLNYLSVQVLDREPERAAAIANFFVEELNRVHTTLSAQNASTFRQFMEQRYRRAEEEFSVSMATMQSFQEEHGVLELPTQAELFLRSVADLRALGIEAEIQLDAMAQQYGAGNAQVEMQRGRVAASRRKVQELLGGSDELMPVPMREMPAMGRRQHLEG